MDLPTIVKADKNQIVFSCGCVTDLDENGCPQIDYENIPTDCHDTYELLESGLCSSLFQLDTGVSTHFCKDIKPKDIDDIALLVAVVRPGTLGVRGPNGHSSATTIVMRRNGEEPVAYDHPSLEGLLKRTEGIQVFQEQIIKVAENLAGFNPDEAFALQKGVAKKDPELIAKLKQKFLEGCKKTGLVDEESAIRVFATAEAASRYSFNRCLSSYTTICYVNGTSELLQTVFQNGSWKGKKSFSLKTWDRPSVNKWDTLVKNSEIVENEILDIRDAGVLPVYRITMKRKKINDNKYSIGMYRKHFEITATANHRMPTRTRGEVRVDQLIVGKDSLYCYDPMQEYRPKYKHAASKIISIERVGEHQCYDVEMAAPYHNFLCNGVFTCNSHAVGYGKLSYITAWTKCHFPLEFYASALRTQEETGGKKEKKFEEKSGLVSEAREFGIELKPPTIEYPFTSYDIKDNSTIVTGISNVRSIGEKEAITIQTYLKEHIEIPNWLNILVFLSPQIKSQAFEGLCLTGFFDKCGLPTRQAKVYEYQTFCKLTNKETDWIKRNFFKFVSLESCIVGLIRNFEEGNKDKGIANKKRVESVRDFLKTLQNPPHNLEDTPITINKSEHSLLTVPLTYSDIEARTLCGIYTDTTCKEFKDGKTKKSMNLAVSITRLKEINTKNGEKMAFLACKDDSGELECVVFPKVYDEFSNLIQEKNTVLITGERSKQQSFVINKIIQI